MHAWPMAQRVAHCTTFHPIPSTTLAPARTLLPNQNNYPSKVQHCEIEGANTVL